MADLEKAGTEMVNLQLSDGKDNKLAPSRQVSRAGERHTG